MPVEIPSSEHQAVLRRILVPLDGSPLAERAVAWAGVLARATDARLLLVRAVFVRTMPGIDASETQLQLIEEAEGYLDGVARQLSHEGIAVDTAVPYGAPADAIVVEARRRRADLIAMATHGQDGFGRWLTGSVAANVLAGAPVPVFLLRAWHTERNIAPLGEQPRLIVPLDGSPLAEAVLPVARALAGHLDGALVLVRAVPRPELLYPHRAELLMYLEEDLSRQRTEARDYLRSIASQLVEPVVAQDVRVGHPAGVIGAAGRAHGAALVVMATHGRTGVRRFLLGSVADAVLREGALPLMLVRSEGLRAPAEQRDAAEEGEPPIPGDASAAGAAY